jgi:hypothetical protein
VADIDLSLVDIDFTKCPEYVFGDTGPGELLGAAVFEDSMRTLSRAEVIAAADKMEAEKSGAEWLVTRIYDQSREGSCVGNACCQSHEVLQAKQVGRDKVVPLSAMSVYRHIGRSPSSGAMVPDGLRHLANVGAVPLDTPANREKFGNVVMPNIGWGSPFPQNWQPTAKAFRVTEWFIIRSVEGMLTALANNLPVVVGRQGHSIAYTGIVNRSGRLLAPYANSWGLRWGQPFGHMTGGFGFDSESQIRMSAGWAFAPRAAVVA